MKQVENIIIGFGKGGKTLGGALASAGQDTVLIERSPQMYGGTCINIACIPTKTLEHSARLSKAIGGGFAEKAGRYTQAVAEKRALVGKLRQKNYNKAVSSGVQVIDGEASFVDDHTVEVRHADGSSEQIRGERIFINTGSVPFIPPIEGVKGNPHVYTSDSMMERDALPQQMVIIGGGYIGLEFASYYNNFGSDVTIIQDGDLFIPREDRQIADEVFKDMKARGIRILKNTKTRAVRDTGEQAQVDIEGPDGVQTLTADAVLVATGRRPALAGLKPENAGVELNGRGAVKTDEYLRTSVPHIWAMGDVAGGLQFTYVSLDDSRIVKDQLLGHEDRNTDNRGEIPYTVFIDPPMSRVGMTEDEAVEKGYAVKTALLPAAAIPKANVMRKPQGLLKAIINGDNDQILGVHLYCAESQEMINLIKLAMDAGIPYTVLRDNIYTHPTMSEALNDLFAAVR
ncbi:MAG: FAD-dependent oxidoreductase [Eubacteriaceae bacterium]|jgi:pyruvate/2-oxoglutarate dehydrogenase complex dihydrolipoamide dehydrogenase (E3) component